MSVFAPELELINGAEPLGVTGRVLTVRGMTLIGEGLATPVGSLVSVGAGVVGEVVGFDSGRAVVMLLGNTEGIRAGDPIRVEQTTQSALVGERMLGRVVNGLGEPIDTPDPIRGRLRRPLTPAPLGAMHRRRIIEPIYTGVRALDLVATLGRGQRLGVFAGPGVGKSTMLGMIARHTSADVNVIALIGERGREVRDFVEQSLGEEGLRRSAIVVATSDESPLMRLRAARVACATAEHFRDAGLDVMLMMDSVTRFAHAQRQVGLSAGEPPATRGYTPSVFANLSQLLERAGAVENGGSITGLYTILVEGDDLTEPVSDAARGILDGHVILSRKLARRSHHPAIDVLDSVSRVAEEICDDEHKAARSRVLRLLATYAEVEDLVQIGAYARGSNPEADAAIELKPRIDALLRQGIAEHEEFASARVRLIELAAEAEQLVGARGGKVN